LGFSKEHRDINIRRIGYVASEITKNGGIAICAPIAPYASVRAENRALIEPLGGYILVHAATPLEVCEQRDTKGLYAKARIGEISNLTGIDDPYEQPENSEIVLSTVDVTPEENAAQILRHLVNEGFVKVEESDAEAN
jgi:sulfate adenylyltransferase